MRKCLAIALLGLFFLSIGCAGEVGDIDRTQPNYVSKSIFNDGNPWYMRKQVIDVPYTTGFTFVGEMGSTEKVIWDIQEDFLIAYRSHEWVIDSEQYAVDMANQARDPDGEYNQWQGAPVAAYRIKSHFDIQREYNPQTGEQTNVIVENTSDRHWYDREHMRVDWSKNLIADFTFVASNIKSNPVQYYIPETEVNNPDRALITPDYVDIVEKIFAEPETDDFLSRWYGFPIPACWLFSSLYFDCLGQNIKIRSSFMKVDLDNDYEPMDYDDLLNDKFGYFRSELYGYDRDRGLVERNRKLKINRFNIWQRTSGDDGELLPYAERGIRPIVFYLSENFPEKLMEPTKVRVADEWNRSFKETVSVLVGESPAEMDDVFVVCSNPVQPTDHPVCGCQDRIPQADNPHCGNVGLSPRLGDLRYSMIYWVAHPQARSPLGYGPVANDMETGEIFGAVAHMYGGALENYAAHARDIINLINGEVTAEEFTMGQHMADYVENLDERRRTERAHRPLRTPDQMMEMLETLDFTRRVERIQQRVASGEAYHDYWAVSREGLSRAPETAALHTDEIARAVGGEISDLSTGAVGDLPKEALTYWLHRDARMQEALQIQMMTGNCIYMPEFMDSAVLSMARELAHLSQEDLLDYLTEEIYVAVTLHEIGHNVGLRHNFAASSDSLNYFDEYWDLRLEHTVDPLWESNRERAYPYGFLPKWTFEHYDSFVQAGSNQPSYAKEQAWNESGISNYQYSSIMDYGARFNADLQLLGKYDDAAIKFGYGQLVEVFDYEFPKENYELVRRPSERHYTTYPKLISPADDTEPEQWVSNMRRRRTVSYQEYLESKQSGEPLVQVPYRFCTDQYIYPIGYSSSWFCNVWDGGADSWEIMENWVSQYDDYYLLNNFKRDRVVVNDFFIYSSYIGRLFRTFNNITNLYKHFVNDNIIVRRGVNCANYRMRRRPDGIHWVRSGDDDYTLHYVSPECGYDRLITSVDMIDFFARVLATPEVGYYKLNEETGYFEEERVNPLYPQCGNPDVDPDDPDCHDEDGNFDPTRLVMGDHIHVGSGIGKHQNTLYDRDVYGYSFYYKPLRIGAWWDKVIAMMAMSDPYTNFKGVDASADTRSFLINTKALWPEQIMNLMGGLMADAPEWFAPMVMDQGYGSYEVVTPSIFDRPVIEGPEDLPEGVRMLDPAIQYTVKLYSAYVSAAMFSWGTDDQDLIQSSRIMLKGNGEGFDLPEGIDPDDEDMVATVWDPITNRTYYAVRYENFDWQPSGTGDDGDFWEPSRDVIPIGYNILRSINERFRCTPEPGPNGGVMAVGPDCDPSGISWQLHYVNILRGMMWWAERQEW